MVDRSTQNLEMILHFYSLSPIEYWVLMELGSTYLYESLRETVKSLLGSWKTGIPQEQIGKIPLQSPLEFSENEIRTAIRSLSKKGYVYRIHSTVDVFRKVA